MLYPDYKCRSRQKTKTKKSNPSIKNFTNTKVKRGKIAGHPLNNFNKLFKILKQDGKERSNLYSRY